MDRAKGREGGINWESGTDCVHWCVKEKQVYNKLSGCALMA